ncbi:hypothetical protein MKMG_00647 [Methanogenium sp. MK-MG]|nr:hypothetical protein MKMG_00647 [Methanogenium sp. MK-MG]
MDKFTTHLLKHNQESFLSRGGMPFMAPELLPFPFAHICVWHICIYLNWLTGGAYVRRCSKVLKHDFTGFACN